MKRPGKKVATDRSFVVALSPRSRCVAPHFIPTTGFLAIQEIAARTNLPKPTVFAADIHFDQARLSYNRFRGFEKYQLRGPSAMGAWVCRPCQSRGSAFCPRPTARKSCAKTGGAVAVGGRDRLSMIYFRPEP